MNKLQALAKHLGEDINDIEILDANIEQEYKCGRQEFLVLTDSEADAKTREYIEDSIWAFDANFLLYHFPDGMTIEVIQAMQEKLCESANAPFKAMIEDLDHFVDEAISAHGRGHFLAGYDFEENEEGDYFIYRTN